MYLVQTFAYNFLFRAQNVSLELKLYDVLLCQYKIPYKISGFGLVLTVSHAVVCSFHYLAFLSPLLLKYRNFFI